MSLSFFRFVYNCFTVTVSMKVIFYDQTGFVVARVLLRVYVSLGCAGRPYCRIQCKVWSSRPAIKSTTTPPHHYYSIGEREKIKRRNYYNKK